MSLKKFAEKLVSQNGDYWLRDLLRFEKRSVLRTAISYLVEAMRANQAGDPASALSAARGATLLFQASNNIAGTSRARFEEVYALHRMSQGSACLEAAQALRHSLNGTKYLWLKAQIGFELSICKGLTGDMGGSLSAVEDALGDARTSGFKTLVLRGLGLLAELRATNGNDSEAWEITQRGVQLLLSGSFPPMRGYQLYAGIAFSAENHKEWYLAVALNREANSFVGGTGNLAIEAMAHYRLASDALMIGDNNLAADQFTKADCLFASLPQTQSWKAYKAYGELVLAGLQAQKNEIARSRELLSESEPNLTNLPDYVVHLNYLQIEGNLDLRSAQPAAAEKAYRSALKIGEKWLGLLHTSYDRLAWNAQMGNIYRALVRLYAVDEGDPAKALEIWEEYHAVAANANSNSGTFFLSGLTSIMQSLTDKTLVAYVQFDDGLGIWLTDNRGLHFYWQAVTASDVERKALRFRSLCSTRLSDARELGGLAKEMYSLLIAPLETHLDSKRILMVEADASLAGIPFSALQDPANHYLVERFAIVLSPGLMFENTIEHQKGHQLLNLRALIVAPSASADSSFDLLPLKDAILESKEVARHFKDPTQLSGRLATLDKFDREIADSGVFHFAGHAVLRGDSIGLVFSHTQDVLAGSSPPRVLFAEAIQKGNLRHLRLVVLAACSTARGPESDPMGRSNLMGEFLRAGVTYVVATDWDIDSATTRTLMEQFYSGLQADLSVPDAIRAAQLNILASAHTAHPYYWAGISGFGGS